MKSPIIILTGPTAVGKTALSISLAKAIGGEIISADSMQVYRRMNIGTAKITKEQMQGVKHYLIDILEPDEEFNVAEFQRRGKEAMKQIYANGNIPILVGGTGFYIQALLYDIDFTPQEKDETYRQSLNALAEERGDEYLFNLLRQVDPDACNEIHQNNRKRVIRALEYYHETGEPISKHNALQREKESPYESAYFVLNHQREILYQRIEERIDEMVREGLVEEVQALKNQGYTKELVSMQGLGYKEIFDYLEGNCTVQEAIYRLKRDTRHFAKRQLTWFRREREVLWLDKQLYSEEELLAQIIQTLKAKQMI